MANHRLVNGKSTLRRLEEEYHKLQDTQERITVVEFARRVEITPSTLTHRYREWAEKVRTLRDEGKLSLRKTSPVTHGRFHVVELEEAEALIAQLRQRVDHLSAQVEVLTRECEQWRKRATRLEQIQDVNERLRGVIITLQQEMVRYLTSEQNQRLLRMVKDYALPLFSASKEGYPANEALQLPLVSVDAPLSIKAKEDQPRSRKKSVWAPL